MTSLCHAPDVFLKEKQIHTMWEDMVEQVGYENREWNIKTGMNEVQNHKQLVKRKQKDLYW